MAIECEVGVHLEVDVGSDTWKPARVTEVGEKGVRYHIAGWDDNTDKWLPALSKKLRLPGGSEGIDWAAAPDSAPPAKRQKTPGSYIGGASRHTLDQEITMRIKDWKNDADGGPFTRGGTSAIRWEAMQAAGWAAAMIYSSTNLENADMVEANLHRRYGDAYMFSRRVLLTKVAGAGGVGGSYDRTYCVFVTYCRGGADGELFNENRPIVTQ